MSFSSISLRSVIPNFIIAIRSTPIPKANPLGSQKFVFKLDLDLLSISFGMVFALGAIWLLVTFFEDDDDQVGGGLGSYAYVPTYVISNPT